MWRSGGRDEQVLSDSERAQALAVMLRAENSTIRASIRETVARARNQRQVGLLRRAVQKRLAELAADRNARASA